MQSVAPIMLAIAVADLEANPVALRTVNKEGLDYIQLKDSIDKDGLINPINVVPALMADGKTLKRSPNGNQVYRICDGLHRFTACRDLGWEFVNCQVLSKTEAELEVAQLVANAKRINTKKYEFAGHLNRILSRDPTMTLAELAGTVSSSAPWIGQLLGMTNLHPDLGKLVDDDKITVSNAVELAKIRPQEEQLGFQQQAMEDPPAIFVPKVKARVKELRDAKRAGRDPNAEPAFVAVSHFRKKTVVESAAASTDGGEIGALVRAAGITDPIEAVRFSLQWILHLDEQSITEAKAKDDARKQQAKADSAKRAAERAAQRATETAAALKT